MTEARREQAMSDAKGSGVPRGILPLAVAGALLFGFYLWTASAGLPSDWGEAQNRPYNLLTRALLKGQLHLDVEPRPELFELSEPYHPGRNAPYRLHDASLYRGRYYLYFGVVPVLTLFLPWGLAGLGDLPQPAAAAVFSLVGFVFSALLLRHLLRRHLPAPPKAALFLAFLVLGLTNVTPFILRGALVYEVAIAAGYAFSAGAAWLFATAGARGTFSLTRLALGGLLLGLAVGSRPNLVLLVPILPLLALSGGRPPSLKAAARPALALMAPLALCGLALGLYNHARFDSWTEFGTRYQLVGVPPIAQFASHAVGPILYYELLAPPALRVDFPFLFADQGWRGSLPEGTFIDSSTAGALAQSPFLLILLALPWILRGAPVRAPGALRRELLTLIGAGLVVPSLTAFVFASAAMRFEVDFVHLLLVPALVLWFVLAVRMGERRRWRWLFRLLVAGVFGWSALAAVALSLTGTDPLRETNPEQFATLEAKAKPLRRIVGMIARDTRTVERLRVAFPERTAEGREPFVSWGRVAAFDVLWVRTVSPGVFSFSLETHTPSTAPPASRASPPVALEPGRFYDVVVQIDRVAGRASLTADGERLFELGGPLVPVSPRHVWPGRGPRGSGARNLGHFSGTMIPEDMWLAGPPGLESLPPIADEPAILTVSRTPPPRATTPGRLWAVAGRRGASILTEGGWRWIPTETLAAVVFERPPADAVMGANHDGEVVPVLVSGDAEDADGVVLIREAGGVAFAFARWDGTWTMAEASARVALDDEGEGTLRVELDWDDQRVAVWVDDQEVLRARARLRPLRPDTLFVGRTPPHRSRRRPEGR
jgi:hypothetical protein